MKNGSLIFWRFIGFAGTGAIATAVHFLILIALVQAGGAEPTVASAFGALAGAFVSYAFNYHYIFRCTASHADAMVKFFIVAGIGLMLNTVFMWIGVKGFGLHYLFSQVIATGLVMSWSFAANYKWTFGRAHG